MSRRLSRGSAKLDDTPKPELNASLRRNFMKKKVVAMLLTALLALGALGTLGSLVGCGDKGNGGGGGGTESSLADESIVSINTHQMTGGEIYFTNYDVALKQTPTEWDALSPEDKREIAQIGYNRVVEQIEANDISNYNVQGMTAAGTNNAGEEVSRQPAFMLDLEGSVLKVYLSAEGLNMPTVVDEISVELP
jgi:hypothetical protein